QSPGRRQPMPDRVRADLSAVKSLTGSSDNSLRAQLIDFTLVECKPFAQYRGSVLPECRRRRQCNKTIGGTCSKFARQCAFRPGRFGDCFIEIACGELA